jgi:3-keto-disaccharide hydrolase
MRAIHFLLCALSLGLFFMASAMPSSAQPLTKPPKGNEWKSLFNGQNLDGWHLKVTPDEHNLKSWTAMNGVLINIPPSEEGMHGVDLVSDVILGNHEIYIEFMVPQGSNSGVYLIGQYEVQVYDSYGKKTPTTGDCGGIYGKTAPSENASLPAGHWQCFHAIFHQAVMENGKVVKKPRITVYHNGKKVIDNCAIEGLTGAALIDHIVEKGPTYLQGNHGTVFYRNIFYKNL